MEEMKAKQGSLEANTHGCERGKGDRSEKS